MILLHVAPSEKPTFISPTIEEVGRDASFTSLIGNTPNFVDEPTLSSFADVPIESFSKFVHFTNASRDLIIKCLQGRFVPTFNQIRERDASLKPLSYTHGRSINSNDSHHIIERWKKNPRECESHKHW